MARSLHRLILEVLSFLIPPKSALRPEGLHRTRGVAGSGFRPLPIFPTAATRRCMDRVSVPLWGATLSGPLPVIALVGHYPTN